MDRALTTPHICRALHQKRRPIGRCWSRSRAALDLSLRLGHPRSVRSKRGRSSKGLVVGEPAKISGLGAYAPSQSGKQEGRNPKVG
jgi:hypothetical protein